MKPRYHIHITLRILILQLAVIVSLASSQPMTDYTGIVFPANHALNTRIDSLPVHPNSQNFINSMGATTSLHPDFGTQWEDNGVAYQMGIPYNVVGVNQPLVPISFTLYDDESDQGPWPIPTNPLIETVFDWRNTADGDRHMLIIDSSKHILYESGNVYGVQNGEKWEGGCGAVWDLTSNKLRPDSWTSADAAGLPIFPLLIRYDEVEMAVQTGGEIPHAIRFTASKTQKSYIWPARHYASSSTNMDLPPMGLRVRLKAAFDISSYSPRIQVILKTFKKYGLIMSDNGSNWYFQGTHDNRWDDNEIDQLKNLHGSDFEAVDITSWTKRSGFDSNSGAVPPVSNSIIKSHCKKSGPDVVQIIHKNQGNTSSAIIMYSVKKSGRVSVKITGLNGRCLLNLFDGYQGAGVYTVNFSTGALYSGIYLIRLQSGNMNAQVKEFVIAR